MKMRMVVILSLLVVFTLPFSTKVYAENNNEEPMYREHEIDELNIDYYDARVVAGVPITLNPNGGSVNPTSINRVVGSRFDLGAPLPIPTRTGWNFRGWYSTSASIGGTRVNNDTIVPQTGLRTLFARWNNSGRHIDFWWQSTTIPMRSFNFNDQWQTPMNTAIADWNNNTSRVSFTTNSTSNNLVTAGSRTHNDLGRFYFHQTSGTSLIRFDIDLNSRTLSSGRTGTVFTNYVRSVFSHELGHVVGLRDNPTGTTVNGSLMNHGRDRNSVTRALAFDIASVNMLY
ncbi:MAG: InlB B-repeat-containing protein [Defluviitaleaceae bacterium]|nr:InlB B-repeat-containing protein [Defluviitaleaceae bacterium]